MTYITVVLTMILVLGCVNLLILIGLAGAVAKLLQYLSGKEVKVDEVMPSRDGSLLNLPTGQFYRDESGQIG